MNSLTRSDYSSDCSHRREHKDNKPILKCGNTGSATVPVGTTAGTTFTLTSVSIDTRRLNDPCIKLEFASNIITTASTGTLQFQVFKLCNNRLTPIAVGPQWIYSKGAATTDGSTFSFFTCDCDTCSQDCCTYTVQATVAGAATAGTTTINNARLAALVIGSECNY